MNSFESIKQLFIDLQPLKRRYPMVVSVLKYLEKLSDDRIEKEVERFRNWLLTNPRVLDRSLDNTLFESKHVICFDNILNSGNTELINTFWNNLSTCEFTIFDNGRPKQEKVEKESESDEAMAILESNPMFADVLTDLKSTVANVDPNDIIGSVVGTKEFNKLVKTMKSGIASGKYKMSDISGSISSVVNAVQNKLDPKTKSAVYDAISLINDVENGKEPNFEKVMALAKDFNIS
jgi:hypothetical protein